MGKSLIPDEIEYLALVFGQLPGRRVEVAPLGNRFRGFARRRDRREFPARVVRRVAVRVVVGPGPLRPVVVFDQAEQFPAYLKGGEAVEVDGRLRRHLGQCPVEPQYGVLVHVVRLLPSPHPHAKSARSMVRVRVRRRSHA